MADLEPKPHQGETRAAAITPLGAAGIAVVRMAGPEAVRIAAGVFDPPPGASGAGRFEPGRVAYGRIVDDDQVIDDVVVMVQPLPARDGGPPEAIVDINPHGGIRVVQRILMLLVRQGARLTDPDEIGLLGWPASGPIEREAWSSLTRAQTHRVAMWLANQQTILPAVLRRCVGRLDAASAADVEAVLAELKGLQNRYEPARRLVEGASIALAGPPNAGKSTLGNRLFGQPRSLVTEQPGTTRDWVAEPAAVEGVPIVLVDTAGLRVTEDAVERSAIERSLGRVVSADVALLVLDRSEGITPSSRYAVTTILDARAPSRTLLVLNKCDLPDRVGASSDLDAAWADRIQISAATGEGLDELGRAIAASMGLAGWSDKTPGIWTSRQRTGIDRAIASLPDRPAAAAAVLSEVAEM